MKKRSVLWPILAILALVGSSLTCTPPSEGPTATPTPTETPRPGGPDDVVSPTPTVVVVIGDDATETPPPTPDSPCDGVSGTIEVFILIGPAAAVGLEPFSVGSVPFTVSSGGAPYVVQGSGHLSYQDILVENWGTYEVTFEADVSVEGECTDQGLVLTATMDGYQFLEVTAEGFHGEYPWEGEAALPLVMPLVDGTMVEGEGYMFVLHLGGS